MRKLKFRVWDTVLKEMTPLENLHVDGCFCWVFDTTGSMIVMQYTGLLDKQGVEIYEGDIVRCAGRDIMSDDYSSTVVYLDGLFRPLVKVKEGYNAIDDYNPNLFKVLGNIYQNPELLKTIPV